MNYYDIGRRIRKYRKACNLSQESLADRVGISTTHMSHIETANTKLSLQVLCDIANELEVGIDDIVYGSSNVSKTSIQNEISELLSSSSIRDLNIMLEVLKSIKIALNKYSND